ncbi:MAG: T9SS type A sorting domain-containing protein [Saprospirales bacterium]|nr:T9SS type A sorting domain-containing protein [Saprospirales bacterium]
MGRLAPLGKHGGERGKLASIGLASESNAVFGNDNCPHDFLTADLAIRKPQQFKPVTGTLVYWQVKDFLTNQILQSGTTLVQADNLTVIPQVEVFRNDIRKVRIEVSTQPVATKEAGKSLFNITVSPNPSTEASTLIVYSEKEQEATVRLSGISGVISFVKKQIHPGENRIPLNDFGLIPAGVYFIAIEAERQQKVVRWVKMKD